MDIYPCFQFTEDDVENLRDGGEDRWLIDCYAEWVRLVPQLDPLITNLERAFAGTRLGEGTGLLEAQGMDDYADPNEQLELRAKDEKCDWRHFAHQLLDRCYAAPSFMDVGGFVFHLPAFLVAELNDMLSIQGFIDSHLLCSPPSPKGWMERLDIAQRDALIAIFQLLAKHPDYRDDPKPRIARTIERLRKA